EYGMCLGVAFQLMDDAMDYISDEAASGKPVGHDLEEGKITLPLIHAMHQDVSLAERVAAIAERDGCYENDDKFWIRERVLQLHGVEYTIKRAQDYANRAKALLPLEGDATLIQLLKDLADFSAQRLY
ncbi:MAG: polyprenyl synthetase family protein, partial [Mariprofundaceae bacterium]|nr:polyprenyl synthetase family protein [Mariprofundaceae bacterium]